MGQENEKVIFQANTIGNQKRKNIFEANKTPTEVCQIPNCKCPMNHTQISNMKVCSKCIEVPPPYIKKTLRPQYIQSNPQNKQSAISSTSTSQKRQYREPNYANNIPNKIPYYNAWSLPIDRCYQEDSYEHEETLHETYLPEKVDVQEEKIEATNQIYFAKEYSNQRRQNMNFY